MKKDTTEEKRQHSSMLIPYSYYDCFIPGYFASVPLHWHKEFEINYIRRGSAEFICNEERFFSREGDIILLPPDALHAIYPRENCEQLYDTIVFSLELLGSSENDRCTREYIRPITNGSVDLPFHITSDHPHYDEIKSFVESIFRCAKENTALSDLLLKGELMRLFWLLNKNGDIISKKNNSVNRNETILPALEYINRNFRETITIEQLADIAHLSKSHFMNRFKQAAGIGAIEYITQLRIKAACELLNSTEKTTAEVAFECGFHNLANFNRQFKKLVGYTPGAYRKL